MYQSYTVRYALSSPFYSWAKQQIPGQLERTLAIFTTISGQSINDSLDNPAWPLLKAIPDSSCEDFWSSYISVLGFPIYEISPIYIDSKIILYKWNMR